MKREIFVKGFVSVLMAAMMALPVMAAAQDAVGGRKQALIETSKTTLASSMVDYEVIQVLRKANTDVVFLNISGQPGDYYRVYYSATGANDSYAIAPKSDGVIGDNGIGSVKIELGQLGKEQVYLRVSIADSGDFRNARTMPMPIVLDAEWMQIKQRGWKETAERKLQGWKHRMQDKFEPRRGWGGGAVRG